jgi:hypothetical protein
VPRDEKATRRLGSDLHLEDTSRASIDLPTTSDAIRGAAALGRTGAETPVRRGVG